MRDRAKLIVGAALAAVLCSACERSPQDRITGKWVTDEGEAKTVVTFGRDSTFVMDFGEWKGEGRYHTVGADAFELKPEGSLAAAVPAGYEGTLAGDSLTLCVATRCSVYHRQ